MSQYRRRRGLATNERTDDAMSARVTRTDSDAPGWRRSSGCSAATTLAGVDDGARPVVDVSCMARAMLRERDECKATTTTTRAAPDDELWSVAQHER